MSQATSTFVDNAEATVEIPGKGKIVGKVAKDAITGQPKSQRYAGIPFAQPPIGSLRWKRPQPLPASFRYDSDDRDYGQFASQSPQPTNYALTNGVTFPEKLLPAQDEDCLYLNIWCPTQPDGSRPTRKLPVLFFIHGGWLQKGNAHMSEEEDPSDLIHSAGLDAIVVATAYRLNVFGFFAHEALRQEDADHLTGNYGFWDQRAALEWVHTNIVHFGGDPDNITVSGLSAGAHSTHSQLLHDFDLSVRNASYKPIIRRVFLQSNAAIWPSKPVDETQSQLDELCTLLNVSTHLSDAEKIASLRAIDAMTLVRVLAKMGMHTFRATRDTQPEAFVKPDWTMAMMDGRFAKWCREHDVRFVIGECADEEWVYRYTNTPTDKPSLLRQVNNYYTLPLVEKMLPYYGVSTGEAPPLSRYHRHSQANGSAAAESDQPSLYSILGIKPSATASEVRAAYLAQVRQHHPDKLQQHGLNQSSPQENARAIADSLPQSDELIRQLNHAYKTLVDDRQRLQYDESLAASRAAATQSLRPRISATVDFEAFRLVEHDGASSTPITFSYACRCGSAYVISEEQAHDEVEVIGCDGCSENIRVRYDNEEEAAAESRGHEAHRAKSAAEWTPDQIGEVFGRICSDSQVYIAERMLITDLVNGGLSPDRILRYRINYRAQILDQVLPQYSGVSHGFDDFIWWFAGLKQGREQEIVKEWLQPWIGFIHAHDVHEQWYAGHMADPKLIRILQKDGSIQVDRDRRWEEKAELIDGMVSVRNQLVDELL